MITYIVSISNKSSSDDGSSRISPESVSKLERTFNIVQPVGADWGLSRTSEIIYRCIRPDEKVLNPEDITNLKDFFMDREKTARIYRLREL